MIQENISKDGTQGVLIESVFPRLQRFSIRGSCSAEVLQRVVGGRAELPEEEDDHNNNNTFFQSIMQSEALFRVWQNGFVLGVNAMDNRFLSGRKAPPHYTPMRENIKSRVHAENDEKREKASGLNAQKKKRFLWKDRISYAQSPLWVEGLRQAATESFVPDHIINTWKHGYKERMKKVQSVNSDILLPNAWDESKRPSSSFPLLLVCKQHTCVEGGFDATLSGWDIIAPAKWGSYLTNELNLAGARAVGLQELNDLRHAAGLSSFPSNFPDTEAGFSYWSSDSVLCPHRGSVYKPLKKVKKQVITKTKMQEIEKLPWVDLFNEKHERITDEDSDFAENVIVIRNEDYIREFDFNSSFLRGKIPAQLSPLPFPTMVTVMLEPSSKGVPMFRADIFAPICKDYQAWLKHHEIASRQVVKPTGRGRLGEWKGVQLINEQSDPSERVLIGYTTTSSVSRRAIGHCHVGRLHETFRQASQYLLSLAVEHIDTSTNTTETPTILRSAHNLVLFRNPNSQFLRPAKLRIISQQTVKGN